MNRPSNSELFQNVLIGTVAGIMSSAVVNRGVLYVFISALALWFVLVIAINLSIPIFKSVRNDENPDDSDDCPHQNVQYAS